nr:MAG TPA: Stage III sporulation protein D [Caudoviricetes sp.]
MYNVNMTKDINPLFAIRQVNLKRLIEESRFKRVSEFADQYGEHRGVIYDILNGSRNMGDVIARRLEESLGKQKGWMDRRVHFEHLARLTDDEMKLVGYFREISEEKKIGLLEAAYSLANEDSVIEEK